MMQTLCMLLQAAATVMALNLRQTERDSYQACGTCEYSVHTSQEFCCCQSQARYLIVGCHLEVQMTAVPSWQQLMGLIWPVHHSVSVIGSLLIAAAASCTLSAPYASILSANRVI